MRGDGDRHRGQFAIWAPAWAMTTIVSPPCVTLSTIRPAGMREEIRRLAGMALIPVGGRRPSHQQISSRLSQTQSCTPKHRLGIYGPHDAADQRHQHRHPRPSDLLGHAHTHQLSGADRRNATHSLSGPRAPEAACRTGTGHDQLDLWTLAPDRVAVLPNAVGDAELVLTMRHLRDTLRTV
jgi:hypothetical protein